MGLWSIVVPEATQNLVSNPSIETNMTGYTAVGAAIARDATQQRRGVYSLKITPTAGVNDGAYYAITLQATKQYTFSVDVLGVNGVPYKIYVYDVTGAVVLATTTFTGTGKWQRVTVTVTTGANTSHRLYVIKNNSADTGIFYADGWQCEQKGYNTTFVDGDQDGCSWDSAVHASTSTRSAQSRLGGRDVDIDSYGVTVSIFSGMGMPSISQLTQDRALLPGSLYRGYKINERPMTLNILANSDSAAGLHLLRKKLIDVIKPDLVTPPQPFLLRYTGAGAMVEIPAVYDTGLEQVVPFGFNETIVLRLLAHDEPLWREDGERGLAITAANAALTTNRIAGRISGVWNNLAGGADNDVLAIAIAPDGMIYAGGLFLNIGGIAANRIAKFSNGAWSALGTGLNAACLCIAISPDGTVYAGGDFTTAGGGAANYIAKWNGANWSALGTGFDNSCKGIAIAPDGALYAVGLFITAGGISANRIAKWDGLTWTALGTGLNAACYAVVVALDGTVYVGGGFTTAGGSSAFRVAKWSSAAWSALGGGLGDVCRALAIGADGTLYAGGDFTTTGNGAANRIASWNGLAWNPLGSGFDNKCHSLAIGEDGTVYAGGDFTKAGDLGLADRVAQWHGFSWSALDIDLPGTASVFALRPKGSDLYLGFNTVGTAIVAADYSVLSGGAVANASTATAYPILTLKRTGGTSATLSHFRNETTGKRLYFNYPLADGEIVTLDLRLGEKSFTSNVFGNLLSKILPGSDLATWALAPFDNTITIYVVPVGGPTIDAWLHWKVQHWAVDGVAI